MKKSQRSEPQLPGLELADMKRYEGTLNPFPIVRRCDRCGAENPKWQECNMCPPCREAFNREIEQHRADDRRAADLAWNHRPQ